MRALAIAILVVLGGGGLYGGIAYVAEPDGSAMGMTPDQLPSWLPGDYLVPGIFLLIAFAAAPAAAIWMLARRSPRAWLWTGAIGVVLVLWMAVQVGFIGFSYPAMQGTFIVVGGVLAGLGWLGVEREGV